MRDAVRGAIRRRLRRFQFAQPGSAPGTLVGDPTAPRPQLRVVAYGPDGVDEQPVEDVASAIAMLGRQPVTWISVNGLGDVEVIRRLGEHFRLHRLALEDIVNVNQRPKVERYDAGLYIVARMIRRGTDQALDSEQLSMVLGDGWLLTFQEHPGEVFEPVRERLRTGRGRLRQAGSGYLAYALLDAVVDHHFPVLESYGETLETLEDEVLDRPSRRTIGAVHTVRRELLTLRRGVWPLRDAVRDLLRDPSDLIEHEDRFYLQDCYDHTVRVIEMLEGYREMAASLMDMYLSSVSNRMNEVMKVLTMFASIFIPLSFIAGLYGMNFNPDRPFNMPELNWPGGYLFALGLMAAVAAGLLFFFWRRGWIGDRDGGS